jgi:hypothetical protein
MVFSHHLKFKNGVEYQTPSMRRSAQKTIATTATHVIFSAYGKITLISASNGTTP